MPREMSPEVLQMVQSAQLAPCLFVEIEFEDETVYLWSGLGNLTPTGPPYNPAATFPYGKTFIGMGWLGQIQTIPQVTDIVASNVTLVLAGIPSELVTDAMTAVRETSIATIWLGTMSMAAGNPAVIGDPVQVFQGALDVPSVHESQATVTISITAENPLIDLNRAPSRRFTDCDQQFDFPGDTGFAQVQLLQDFNVVWPSPYGQNTSTNPPPPNYLVLTPGQAAPIAIAVGGTQAMVGIVTNSDGSTEIVAGPGTGSDVGCDWSSSDPSVATPVGDGEGAGAGIQAVGSGMCVITAGFVQARFRGTGPSKPSQRITASVTVIVTEAP